MKKKIVIIDAGHGGINQRGKYTTSPEKMFKHRHGNFHDGSIFYEGVFNREIGKMICEMLAKNGISYVTTWDDKKPYNDNSLPSRTKIENALYRAGFETLFISIHANAFDTKERGFIVFTHHGQSDSDKFAETLYHHVSCAMGKVIKIRKDVSDGDMDHEENFYVLRKTLGASILVEHLFFDNFNDANLLKLESVKSTFVDCYEKMIFDWINGKII